MARQPSETVEEQSVHRTMDRPTDRPTGQVERKKVPSVHTHDITTYMHTKKGHASTYRGPDPILHPPHRADFEGRLLLRRVLVHQTL